MMYIKSFQIGMVLLQGQLIVSVVSDKKTGSSTAGTRFTLVIIRSDSVGRNMLNTVKVV